MPDYWLVLLICLPLLAPKVPEFLGRFSAFSGKMLRVFREDYHRIENRWHTISSSPTDTTLSSLSLLSFITLL
jgi:hypothetical protein